ncbi:MAG: BREX-1 system adenine-specific DNA-methyltransferase PglX, partial [Candidatus Zixiibacteriota bacterium]
TIGWVYQYFTPKELRDKARKESQAPRNSYELAFRNQFFTPRYVVEFLTDNTLGRIWYEMRKGKTALKDRCRYLVRRPTEIFLKKGEEPTAESKDAREDLSQEELLKQPVYIPHRPKKDPRKIKVLDPAGGSGHFLLYCFDLFQVIYEEAYDDPDLGAALRRDYPAIEDLRRAVPGLILKHNLHGIDIDLRATQIAALALWLRCQRAYQEMGLKNGERPKITRSNIVCAEPMPGETDLLKEFTATLQPRVLGQLVETIFEKMKLAGEAGSLLKIEEEIRDAASSAKEEYQEELRRRKEHAGYLPGMAPQRERTLFDFSDMSDSEFLDRSEEEIVTALRQYAEKSSNGKAFRRRLFAEDAARGFGFLELSHHKYDAVLMNPPFGEFAKAYKAQAREDYPNSYNDIFAAFTERWYWKLVDNGALGAITSRVGFFLTSFRRWRSEFLLRYRSLTAIADLGEAVMDDALVESATYILNRTPCCGKTTVVRLLGQADRGNKLLESLTQMSEESISDSMFIVDLHSCASLPDAPIVYWIDPSVIESLARMPHFEPTVAQVRQGLVTGDNPRFTRGIWEVPFSELNTRGKFGLNSTATWAPLVMKGPSQPWYSPITVVVNWHKDGNEIKHFVDDNGKLMSRPQNTRFYFQPGLSWTLRAVRFIPYAIPSGCIPTASRYMAFPDHGSEFTCLGVGAANIASAFLRFYGEWFCRPKFLVDKVKMLPWPKIPTFTVTRLRELVSGEVARRRRTYQNHEPFHDFVAPSIVFPITGENSLAFDLSSFLGEEMEREVAAAYGFDEEQYRTITRDLREAIAFKTAGSASNVAEEDNDENDKDDTDFIIRDDKQAQNEALVSYSVGIALGRWDIRFATGERQPPELPDPFDPLPICPPGILQGPNGLPAKPEDVPSNYPLRIDWDGILVDDPGHEDDIVRGVRDVLELIWK